MSEVNQAAYRVSDDGKVVPCGPDEQPRYTTERYRRERLVANQREAVFYTHERLSIEQAVVQLVVGYRCSVLDSQEEQHR